MNDDHEELDDDERFERERFELYQQLLREYLRVNPELRRVYERSGSGAFSRSVSR